MEAAVRAFEDWEFRVLEQESGIDEEDDSAEDKVLDEERKVELEKEISCQQHAMSAAQVNNQQRVPHVLVCRLAVSSLFANIELSL